MILQSSTKWLVTPVTLRPPVHRGTPCRQTASVAFGVYTWVRLMFTFLLHHGSCQVMGGEGFPRVSSPPSAAAMNSFSLPSFSPPLFSYFFFLLFCFLNLLFYFAVRLEVFWPSPTSSDSYYLAWLTSFLGESRRQCPLAIYHQTFHGWSILLDATTSVSHPQALAYHLLSSSSSPLYFLWCFLGPQI